MLVGMANARCKCHKNDSSYASGSAASHNHHLTPCTYHNYSSGNNFATPNCTHVTNSGIPRAVQVQHDCNNAVLTADQLFKTISSKSNPLNASQNTCNIEIENMPFPPIVDNTTAFPHVGRPSHNQEFHPPDDITSADLSFIFNEGADDFLETACTN